PGRAAAWYGQAAELALEGNDLVAALAHADRALACGAEDAAVGALHLVQASAHDWRGENVEAVQRGREAMAALSPTDPRWHRAAAVVGVASRRIGDRAQLM